MMSIDEIERNNVKSSIVFSKLSDEEFELLLGSMKKRSLDKGELLFRQGDTGDSMAVVADGALIVRVQRPDGVVIDIEEVKAGEVLGEMTCVDPAERSANVEATLVSSGLRQNVVYELDRNTLGALQQNAPNIANSILSGIISLVNMRLRGLDARIRGKLPQLDAPREQVRATRSGGDSDAGEIRRLPPGSDPSAMKGLVLPPGIQPGDLDIFATVCPFLEYPAGSYLCREGDPGATCFILLSGELEVIRATEEGDRLLTTMSPGSVAGQMALVDSAPRSADLRVSKNALVLEMSRDDFQKLIDNSSPLGVRFQEQIAIAAIRQHRAAIERLKTVIDMVERPTAPPTGTGQAESAPEASLDQEVEALISDYLVGLDEWGVSLNELDDVKVSVPDGQITTAEIWARQLSH